MRIGGCLHKGREMETGGHAERWPETECPDTGTTGMQVDNVGVRGNSLRLDGADMEWSCS